MINEESNKSIGDLIDEAFDLAIEGWKTEIENRVKHDQGCKKQFTEYTPLPHIDN